MLSSPARRLRQLRDLSQPICWNLRSVEVSRARTPLVGRGCRTVSQSRSATREEVDGIVQAGRRGPRHSGRRRHWKREEVDRQRRLQPLHTNMFCRRGGVSVWRTPPLCLSM